MSKVKRYKTRYIHNYSKLFKTIVQNYNYYFQMVHMKYIYLSLSIIILFEKRH